jgi:hypothetical protein
MGFPNSKKGGFMKKLIEESQAESLGRETDGELHSGIFPMTLAVPGADDELGLHPRLTPKPLGQIIGAH